MHKVQPPIKPAISSTIPNQVDDNDEDMWGNDTDDDIFNNKELESIITQASPPISKPQPKVETSHNFCDTDDDLLLELEEQCSKENIVVAQNKKPAPTKKLVTKRIEYDESSSSDEDKSSTIKKSARPVNSPKRALPSWFSTQGGSFSKPNDALKAKRKKNFF